MRFLTEKHDVTVNYAVNLISVLTQYWRLIWKLHINAEKVSTDLILYPSHQSHTAIKHIYCAASIYGHTLPPMKNQREGGAEFDVSTVKKVSNMGTTADRSGFCMSDDLPVSECH